MQTINEAYVGKTRELLEIEKQLGRFRSKWMGQMIAKDECNEDIELIKLNRMFEKFTGFNPFCLNIITSKQINAMTFPIGMRFDVPVDLSKDIKVSSAGMKMDPKKEYCLLTYIYSGLIFNEEYTDGEILAILLHEIGHNFAGGVIPSIGFLDLVHKFQGFVITCLSLGVGGLIYTNAGVKFKERIGNWLMKNGMINLIVRTARNFNSIFEYIGIEIQGFYAMFNLGMDRIMAYIQHLMYSCMYNPALLLSNILGYGNENFADQYAAMHGYGPELSSALHKMSYNGPSEVRNAIQKVPILGALMAMSETVCYMIISPIEPHPLVPRRMKTCIELCQEELKSGRMDPKVKKRLLEDLKKLEKQSKDYEEGSRNCDYSAIKKLYFGFMFDILGGDIRHFLFKVADAETFKRKVDELNPMKKVKLK